MHGVIRRSRVYSKWKDSKNNLLGKINWVTVVLPRSWKDLVLRTTVFVQNIIRIALESLTRARKHHHSLVAMDLQLKVMQIISSKQPGSKQEKVKWFIRDFCFGKLHHLPQRSWGTPVRGRKSQLWHALLHWNQEMLLLKPRQAGSMHEAVR